MAHARRFASFIEDEGSQTLTREDLEKRWTHTLGKIALQSFYD